MLLVLKRILCYLLLTHEDFKPAFFRAKSVSSLNEITEEWMLVEKYECTPNVHFQYHFWWTTDLSKRFCETILLRFSEKMKQLYRIIHVCRIYYTKSNNILKLPENNKIWKIYTDFCLVKIYYLLVTKMKKKFKA